MRPTAFALLWSLSLLLAVQAGRGRGRGYNRSDGRTDHRGGYRGYGRGYGGGRGRDFGGYGGYVRAFGGNYGGRRSGDRSGYDAPPPPTGECRPPCYRTYGVPGQEKCACPGKYDYHAQYYHVHQERIQHHNSDCDWHY